MRWFHRQNGHAFTFNLENFAGWLEGKPQSSVTLSSIARKVRETFDTEYCAIHAWNGDRGKNDSGVSAGRIEDCPDSLKITIDHPAGTLELAEEQQLGVRNFPIPCCDDTRGILVVKSQSLSDDQIRTIAATIGKRMIHAT